MPGKGDKFFATHDKVHGKMIFITQLFKKQPLACLALVMEKETLCADVMDEGVYII